MKTPDAAASKHQSVGQAVGAAIRRALARKQYRSILAAIVLLVTAFAVINFFVSHPAYLQQLRHVQPAAIVLVIMLNLPAMAALAWAYDSMLRLCGVGLAAKENILLTAYSSLVNFFGPFQSGPGVRSVYLKTRHGVRVRDYMLATLLYYGMFASCSALFLIIGVRPWWQAGLAVVVAISISLVVIRWSMRCQTDETPERGRFTLRARWLASLAGATFLQLCCITAYYFVELRAVNPAISLGQAVSYTGAANFSLFVSLTPDAVGFREAFLVFSQRLHHISTANILAANIIDRGAYLLFLGLLLAFVVTVHAKDRLHLGKQR